MSDYWNAFNLANGLLDDREKSSLLLTLEEEMMVERANAFMCNHYIFHPHAYIDECVKIAKPFYDRLNGITQEGYDAKKNFDELEARLYKKY